MPRATPGAVSLLVLIVTAAHAGFVPRAEQFIREHGTPEQQRRLRTALGRQLHLGRADAGILRRHGPAL
ncbi:MAG: hypothetical protein WDN49_09880 [Acetobacteraceae bacterium]